jgi:hypothetical protein
MSTAFSYAGSAAMVSQMSEPPSLATICTCGKLASARVFFSVWT